MGQRRQSLIVLNEKPPLFDEINAKFNVSGKGVIFAWGKAIYNPDGVKIAPCIYAHEMAHMLRQRAVGVEAWWRRYIDDDDFRLAEEVIGHRAEMTCRLVELRQPIAHASRQRIIEETVTRLRNSMYQYKVSHEDMYRLLRGSAA